ncbi:hypothetical protein RFI_15656, partial [Reticulomyxa filosa]
GVHYVGFLEQVLKLAKFTHTGLLMVNPRSRDENEKEKKRFAKLGVEMSIVDKETLKERFPCISSDIGEFDNTGEREYIPREMANETLLLTFCLFVLYAILFFFFKKNKNKKKRILGYFEPVQALVDLQHCIRTHYASRVELHYNTEVTEVLHHGGHVTGVTVRNRTDKQKHTIYSDTVINCNGPWYERVVNEMLNGLDIKFTIKPVRIQVCFKDVPQLFHPDLLHKYHLRVPVPVIADTLTGIYMRPQVNSKQILFSTIKEEEERDVINPDECPVELGADPDMRDKYLHSFYHRLSPVLDPSQPGSQKVQSLSGMYTVNEEDAHPIIGETKLKGFWVANAFTGHGFKIAPQVGSILARNITRTTLPDDSTVDINFYSPYRSPLQLAVKNVFA